MVNLVSGTREGRQLIRILGRVRRVVWGAAPLLAHVGVAVASLASPLQGQDIDAAPRSVLEDVMPGADRFESGGESAPVKLAYQGDQLLGYVFTTSDFPPEVTGYSGPVRAVVGLTTAGILTGVRVTDYNESRRYDWGDFLSDPWLLDQFPGRSVEERFRVNQDIDGIAQVTISVRALARGVRDAAREVALAYLSDDSGAVRPMSDAELESLSWYELRRRGVAVSMSVVQQGRARFDVALIHVPTQAFGAYLLGRRYEAVVTAVERRGGADHVILYVVPGTGFQPPLREGWSIEQGGGTYAVPSDDVVSAGVPGGGALYEEASLVGALLLDDEDVDIAEPLTIAFDRGRPELGTFRVAYTSQIALRRLAERLSTPATAGPATAEPATAGPATPVAPSAAVAASAPEASSPPPVVPSTEAPAPTTVTDAVAAQEPSELPAEQLVQFDFSQLDDEVTRVGPLAATSWLRVGWVVLVITLAAFAFFTEIAALRWVSLGATLVVLGWVDGGFLSISHLTGLIWVGPSAITSDLPLLIMVGVTLVSVLLWGRVFCGNLCPFGALQDFIDRLVPARFKRALPKNVHRVALKAKYVILAVILLPAIAGSHASLYQYFEPFGTVFFVGRNPLLWVIAGSVLVASAVVPRFYCRYACPLGASLAVASLVSIRRVPRVEQCDYCKVCEQHCPTGAIDGPVLDFKECVRCNQCEIRLVEKSGVCRHDMAEVRPRLVHIKARTPAGVTG
ncbi:MAG: 4Fe-4S binding protein [Gemmatimonadetes bacterium]|nr:4Fe-4S binding protein [Gemmatimonadota bacterium]